MPGLGISRSELKPGMPIRNGNSERKISNRKPERDIRQEKPAEGLKLHAFRLAVPLPGKTEPLSLDLLPPWKGAWKVSKV